MMKKHVSGHLLVAAMAAFLSFAAGAGCSDNNTETLRTGDHCGDACERYAACFNPNFDVNACENNCEARLDDTTIQVQTTEDCVDCIGVNLCSETTYTCANVCASIIIID